MSKPLDRITLLETFVRIADAGSISAAARDLGLSQPSASRQLAELESRLQAQLVRRTTHSLALTDAGADLLGDARRLLDSWEALEEKHQTGATEVRGRLNVVAPVALGQQHLADIAWQFQHEHPGVSITWQLDDAPIRFAEVGCDCWINIGPVPDDALVVRRLGTVERMLVAAPAFVKEHGQPKTPGQAERLPLVALQPFEGRQVPLHNRKRSTTIRPEARMQTNNIFALHSAMAMGLGMAIMPRWFVAEALAAGEVIDLLPGWRAPSLDIQVAYLPGSHQTLRLRAFLDAITTAVPGIDGIEPIKIP